MLVHPAKDKHCIEALGIVCDTRFSAVRRSIKQPSTEIINVVMNKFSSVVILADRKVDDVTTCLLHCFEVVHDVVGRLSHF